jgi:hypothetical protein
MPRPWRQAVPASVVLPVPVGGTVLDSLPFPAWEYALEYVLEDGEGRERGRATPEPAGLFPELTLPGHPEWEALYRAAWDLAWKRLYAAPVPAGAVYNDYPDNGCTYVWDTCFCIQFQRYALPGNRYPATSALDTFYSLEQDGGYIPRCFHVCDLHLRKDITSPCATGTNPPLFAWAEWSCYRMTGDRERLERVLPVLMRHYDWIESHVQIRPGRYRWDGNGSGWDNINWNRGADAIEWWVEWPALQALAARHIALIATACVKPDIARRFEAQLAVKAAQMEDYWDPASNWYCSLTADGRPTRKTLAGFWAVLADIVPPARLASIVDRVLMNPDCFLTEPMPLPVLSKDSPGYNPKGEYWLGGVWINMSLVVIQALEQHGFAGQARELTRRTLNGLSATYRWPEAPGTLWEAYAPEYPAPASHKREYPDRLGTVRRDFGGWTGCLINLLIEHVLGICVLAHDHIVWDLRSGPGSGIERLRIGGITTSLRVVEEDRDTGKTTVAISSDGPYTLCVRKHGREHRVDIKQGERRMTCEWGVEATS